MNSRDQSIVAVDADGNCGFTALMGENRAITREQFIEDVQERYLAGDNQVLNTLIARAIQEAGARDIHDWRAWQLALFDAAADHKGIGLQAPL